MKKLLIEPCLPKDLSLIQELLQQGIAYQQAKGVAVWKAFDEQSILVDISAGLQYKVITGNDIACIFSIRYSDSSIWRSKEKGDALYLHRIAVNPVYKGQKQFGNILAWAEKLAKKKRLSYIRLDVWADNPTIISYYEGYGFHFTEFYQTNNADQFSSQYKNVRLALLEYPLR